jgi:hypothetical protein
MMVLSVLSKTIQVNESPAGIGSGGQNGEVTRLIFRGTAILICSENTGQFPISASSILLSHALLIFGTPGNRLFDVSPLCNGWPTSHDFVRKCDVTEIRAAL